MPPIECRIAEACEGVDPNEPECSRQADESCESTDDNPCVCLEVATEICSSGYEGTVLQQQELFTARLRYTPQFLFSLSASLIKLEIDRRASAF